MLAVNTLDTKKEKPYRDAAEEDLPKAWRKDAKIEIDKDDPVTVNVRLTVPIVLPGIGSPWTVSDHASTSVEDEPLPPSQTEGRAQDAMRRRLADERGQASAELMGMMGWLMLVTLIVWQVALAAWTYTQVSNAARTASRVEARGGDAKKAVRNALSAPLRKSIEKIKIEGERATVKVRMPLVLPGIFRLDRACSPPAAAELPG